MEKIIAVIQARMGSTRLPGKVLADIEGKPLIWHIYKKLQKISSISEVIISTTNNLTDNPLIEFAKKEKIAFYTGSENNLIDRIYQTGKKFDCDIIVKINADSPLIDINVIENGIAKFLSFKKKPDLVTNCVKETFPDGMQYAIFNFKTIENLRNTIKENFWKEFFYRFIIENQNKYFVINLENNKDISKLRWTVDYKEDLELVRIIFKKLYSKNQFFGMNEILNLLNENPELIKINNKYSAAAGINEYNNLKKKFMNQ
jgi:spore coat polysaccharide biosynthesis protein SpsF